MGGIAVDHINMSKHQIKGNQDNGAFGFFQWGQGVSHPVLDPQDSTNDQSSNHHQQQHINNKDPKTSPSTTPHGIQQ
jgi:hypothetical protein